jgi:hypothetical protein
MTRIIGLLLAGAVATAAPTAQALTGDFDFSTGGTFDGSTAQFTSNGVTVNISAILTDGNTNTRTITQTSNGLGVRTTDGGGGGFANEVDNIGPDEALVFDFGVPASFAGGSLRLAGNFFGIFDQYQVFGGNTLPVSGFSSFGGIVSAGFTSLVSDVGCDGGNLEVCTETFSLSNLGVFRYLIVAAPGTGGSNDSFAVKGLTGVSPIPVPAALPLLASGVACFAWLRRTKRRQAA